MCAATLRRYLLGLGQSALVVLSGCAAYRPCDQPSVASPGAVSPPHECRVDGCTLAPDFDFLDCCDEHDVLYWAGGTVGDRLAADLALRECIAAANHEVLGELYYLGVRMGGTPNLPTPWRWGFGWDYPHGYDAQQERADPASHPGAEVTD